MNVGKRIRLNRLFAPPSGNLCSVAVDHLIDYDEHMPDSLRAIQPTLAAIVAARPSAVTMHRGLVTSVWEPHAGLVPLIVQTSLVRVDDRVCEQIVTAEEAVCLGADAIAVTAFVRGPNETATLRTVAECVREAAHFELPVICHAYPRDLSGEAPRVSSAPEDVAWAVRCAFEMGVDVVKAPYCSDRQAYAQIVAECPVPLVAAGGPRAQTLESALALMAEVVESGARGATIGRNVWGFDQITAAVTAFKAVIHDGNTPQEALRVAGL